MDAEGKSPRSEEGLRRTKLKSFISITVPHDAILATAILAAAFQILGGIGIVPELVFLTAFFALTTTALNSLNQVTDIESDRLAWAERPLPRGDISRAAALRFTFLLIVISWILMGAALSQHFSPSLLLLAALDSLLPGFYSLRPIRLKRIPIIKNLLLPAHVIAVPYLATLTLGASPTFFPTIIIVLLVLDGTATLMIADHVSIEGDRILGDRTAPMVLGIRLSRITIQSIYLLSALIGMGLYIKDQTKLLWIIVSFSHLGLVGFTSRIDGAKSSEAVYRRNSFLAFLIGILILTGVFLGLL